MNATRAIPARTRPRLEEAARSTLAIAGGALLVYAGLAKLVDLADFERILRLHALISERWIRQAASGVGIAELSAGVLALSLGLLARRTGTALMVLGAAFLTTAVYAGALMAAPPPAPAPCGCGFASAVVADWSTIAARNLAIATALLLYGAAGPLSRAGIVTPAGVPDRPATR